MRKLRLAFQSAADFEREFHSNLSKGGVFVPSDESFELREFLSVELALDYRHSVVTLKGEVVHLVPPDMAELGGTPGVAVQFQGPAQAVRDRLASILEAGSEPEAYGPPEQRYAKRMPVRVVAKIEGGKGAVEGHTRDLSQSGVLVSVPGRGLPVGERVHLTLDDPESGETVAVEGRVARELRSDEGTAAVAIEFTTPQATEPGFEGFVDRVQTRQHTQRLGAIRGAIEELGPHSLLSMFANAVPAGTFTLRRGSEEALVGFEGGLLHYARVGGESGVAALVRLLGWSEGSFEFRVGFEPLETNEPPLPFASALLEAACQFDEANAIELDTTLAPLDPDARVRVLDGGAQEEALAKVAQAVIDLARAGFTVGRMLEVIPEPHAEIHAALRTLLDAGHIALD